MTQVIIYCVIKSIMPTLDNMSLSDATFLFLAFTGVQCIFYATLHFYIEEEHMCLTFDQIIDLERLEIKMREKLFLSMKWLRFGKTTLNFKRQRLPYIKGYIDLEKDITAENLLLLDDRLWECESRNIDEPSFLLTNFALQKIFGLKINENETSFKNFLRLLSSEGPLVSRAKEDPLTSDVNDERLMQCILCIQSVVSILETICRTYVRKKNYVLLFESAKEFLLSLSKISKDRLNKNLVNPKDDETVSIVNNENLKKTEQKTHIPDNFRCSITQEIMKEPVICSDGHTYEKEAITRWLRNNDTSPITNTILENKRLLIPNYSLKGAIEEWQSF